MRILYLHQYFNIPESGGPLRSYFIAKAMVDAGHHVTVLTTTNQVQKYWQDVEGIKVLYLPIEYSNSMNAYHRIKAFIKYIMSVYQNIAKLGEFDKCYATSTPLTVGILAIYIKRKLNIPFIFEVRDLWPKVPIELGMVNNLWPKKLLYKLEKKIYHHAESIVVLSPTMENYVREIEPKKTVSLIPNMADCDYFSSKTSPSEKAFTIGYIGALGYANGIESVLSLIEKLSQHTDIKFIIAGEGKYEKEVVQASKKLNQLNYLGKLDRTGVKAFYDQIDATLISFRNHPTLEQNSPNKFFEGLAASKVCLTNTRGWVKDLIEKNNCGFYLNPNDLKSSSETVLALSKDLALIEEQKQNASLLAKQYSRRKLTQKVLDLI